MIVFVDVDVDVDVGVDVDVQDKRRVSRVRRAMVPSPANPRK